MKTQKTLQTLAINVRLLIMIGVITLAMVPAGRAGLAIPYTADAGTLHLWHLYSTNNMQCPDSQSNNVQTTPMTLVVTPGQINVPDGTPTQFPSIQPAEFAALGSGIQFTQYTCLYGPYNVITNSDGTTNFNGGVDGCTPMNTNMTDYANPTTGAYTWEAVICPLVSVVNPPYIMQLITSDSGFTAASPNGRAWQIRFTGGHFEYIDISSASPNSTFDGNIPTTGPDAALVGGWYHVALAFSGTAPTNGDAANQLTMYWTRLDPANTNAHVIGTFTKTTKQAGNPVFCISGSARANIWNNVGGGAGFQGIIQEVRISGVNRNASQMAFNNLNNSLPPLVVLQPPATTLVAYGQTLTIPASVFGSPTPVLTWTQNGVPVPGQTNNSLVISNVTFATAGTYQCNATNSSGGTNTINCVVTVGASIDSLWNSGVDNNGNPLDVTAPGSVDLHYLLEQTADAYSTIPNAIVWNSSLGAYAPDAATAAWIGPEQNSGLGANTAGTYDFQTHFYVDQGDPATATVTGSIIPAYGTGAGNSFQVILNGTVNTYTATLNPLTTPVPFTLTSANGLVAGSNSVDFVLSGNGTSAVGIQVQLGGICTNALAPGLPVINTEPPANQTVPYGSTALIAQVTLGRPPLTFQWYSNGTAIFGATAQTLSFVATNFAPSQVAGGQFAANYQVVASNGSGSVTSSVDTVTIQLPILTVASAGVPIWYPTNNETSIFVIFSTGVDPATATTVGNYSLNNGATVLSATLGDAPNKVILNTSILTPGTGYTLSVQNVNDNFNDTMSPALASVGIYPAATALWVKANTGITTDANGVNQWNDLSPNGNNLNSSGLLEPQLATNAFNGYPVIRFAATNGDYMLAGDATSLEITNNLSVFVVVNYATLAGGTNGMIVSKTAGSQPAPYDYYANSTTVTLLRGNGVANQTKSVTAAKVPTVGFPHVLDVMMQGTTVTHRLDGNTNGGGNLGTTIADTQQPVFIGTRADGGNHLSGDLAELIVVGSSVTTNDVTSLETYLANEYHVPIGTNTYPSITQQPPASTNVSQGGTLMVSAAATGNPAVSSYQWYDTNNIAITGQTNATLVISNIQTSDSYYLQAANAFGAINSSKIVVNIISGLNVSLGPPSVTVYTGIPYVMTVQASGTVPFYYQWYQGASPILNATNASYTAVATPVSTSYSCTVTNAYNGYSLTNAGPVSLIGIAAPTNLYQAMVLSNNPIAFWRLNEGPDNGTGNKGTLAYDYVGGHNAAYTNTILGSAGFSLLSSTDTAAIFGEFSSLKTNSYAGEITGNGTSPINFATPTGSNAELSVEAWIVSSNTQVGGAAIIAKGYGSGGEQFDLDIATDFRFFVRDASGATHGPTSTVAPVVGQWYHVVGVFDGATGAARLYINGVDSADVTNLATGLGLLTATTTNTALPQAAFVSIGARSSGLGATNYAFQFQGKIDDVALYNYALSPTKVLADYLGGLKNIVFNASPTNIAFSATGSQLSLSWPLDHTGWRLVAQTNNLLGTNWVSVTPSGALTNQVTVPINRTNGSVFYRLVYP
ncbi:MAG TPA: LamG-like jellyroll fold domain-containing protein [Candidatus Sulfotelmatobacter sp.]|jgi:hypothetical protein|nr:LamG-like jellyroll fold domain-containing protein [Candidatus Sulfotelmatobacter sp.]